MWPRKCVAPKAEPTTGGRRQHGEPKSDRCGSFTSAGWKRQHGGKDMPSNWRSPPRPSAKSPEQVDRITGSTGKSIEGERVTDGFVVALRRGNARGAKGPCHLQRLRRKEGKDEMTKASIDLQDLRRRIYVKVKAELPGVSGLIRLYAQKQKGLGWERWIRQSRKSPQQDRSHKPWHEANGGA